MTRFLTFLRSQRMLIVAVGVGVFLELFRIRLWFHAERGLHLLHVFLIATILAYVLTPEVREFARKVNVLDHPSDRKLQTEAIPLLGGVAIYMAFALTIVQNLSFSEEMKGMLIGGGIIFIVGLLDDLLNLLPSTKLLGQVLAVMVMVNMGFWGGTIKQAIILIFVVGITNAFNYIDGLDGLAAGVGAIAAGFYTILALGAGTSHNYVAFVAAALAGACLGFLVHNTKPATLYMGDCGSEFIGFNLAAIGVIGGWYIDERDIVVSLSVPILILGVLIFDMCLTTVLRFVEGKVKTIPELLAYAGRDHFHHRLTTLLGSDRRAVLMIYLISLFLGFTALAVRMMDRGPRYAMIGLVVVVGGFGIAYLHRVR